MARMVDTKLTPDSAMGDDFFKAFGLFCEECVRSSAFFFFGAFMFGATCGEGFAGVFHSGAELVADFALFGGGIPCESGSCAVRDVGLRHVVENAVCDEVDGDGFAKHLADLFRLEFGEMFGGGFARFGDVELYFRRYHRISVGRVAHCSMRGADRFGFAILRHPGKLRRIL